MVFPSRIRLAAILLLIFAVGLLTACETPSPSTGDVQSVPQVDEQPPADEGAVQPTAEGEAPTAGDTITETAAVPPTDTVSEDGYPAPAAADTMTDTAETTEPAAETPVTEPTAEPAEEPAAEEPAAETPAADESPRPEDEQPADESTDESVFDDADEENTGAEEGSESAAETPAAETPTKTTMEETTAEPTTTAEGDIIHTVQAGQNLYRIGLQYGYSWVTLANYNGLGNADALMVGQEVRIPARESGEATTEPAPTPTPVPTDEVTYTVQEGDNLYRIGLAYDLDWRQIAEANGIVNPNQIYVGQTLKIPTNTPGDSPEFTHTVQMGETLFDIATVYGVTWQAIAEQNDLSAPYVIYPDQTLQIPSE